jgi:gas vesicle protein
VTAALRYLLILGAGLTIGGIVGFGCGWLHRDREAQTEHADLVRKANVALDAIAAELAMAYAPEDFALWADELRRP